MSYISSTLVDGEKVIYQGNISKWYLFWSIFFGFACLLGALYVLINTDSKVLLYILLALGVALLIYSYITYISTELAFTNMRVIAKTGFIQRRTIEINIKKVEAVQVDQSIFGRILNFGSIMVSGAGEPQAPIKGISNPIKFRNEFMTYTS